MKRLLSSKYFHLSWLTIIPSTLFFLLQMPEDKKSLVSLLSLFPFWVLINYWQLPKKKENEDSKMLFMLALGYGLNCFLFIIFVTFLLFLNAVMGLNFLSLYKFFFPFICFFAGMLALFFHQREMGRFHYYGLDYHKHAKIKGEENSESEYASMDQTLKALSLLGLEADLNLDDLKKRYHELAFLYHPDTLASMDEKRRQIAEEEFKRIKHAYEIVEANLKNGRL